MDISTLCVIRYGDMNNNLELYMYHCTFFQENVFSVCWKKNNYYLFLISDNLFIFSHSIALESKNIAVETRKQWIRQNNW